MFNQALDGSASANLLVDLDIAVLAAGWTGKTVVPGGFRYDLLSPQGLTCRCRITDSIFAANRVDIQFSDTADVAFGPLHRILTTAARIYQIHVSPCQIFLSELGVTRADSRSMSGGIPFVPEDVGDCHDDVTPTLTTEAWWSIGSSSSGSGVDFRCFHFSDVTWGTFINGTLQRGSPDAAFPNIPYTDQDRLRLSVPALAINIDTFFGIIQRTRHYGGGELPTDDRPLYVEPFLIWASKMRGQIYDALCPTLDRPIDYLDILYDTTLGSFQFINWMHDSQREVPSDNYGSRYGCLYLLTSDAVGDTVTLKGGYVY